MLDVSPSPVFGITTSDGHVLTMDDGDSAGDSKNIRLRTKAGAPSINGRHNWYCPYNEL